MNVLIISAHPDDAILGAGGTIAKHAEKGDNVFVCVLSEGATARYGKKMISKLREFDKKAGKILGVEKNYYFDFPNIKMNSVPMLEIVKSIEKCIIESKPEIVYTHHWGDLNIDHRVVFDATSAAIRLPERGRTSLEKNLIKKVLCYEVPSSTNWAPQIKKFNFNPNVFVDVSKYFNKKLKALKCYKSEVKKFPNPLSEEGILVLAKNRGMMVSMQLAEAFELIRDISHLDGGNK